MLGHHTGTVRMTSNNFHCEYMVLSGRLLLSVLGIHIPLYLDAADELASGVIWHDVMPEVAAKCHSCFPCHSSDAQIGDDFPFFVLFCCAVWN